MRLCPRTDPDGHPVDLPLHFDAPDPVAAIVKAIDRVKHGAGRLLMAACREQFLPEQEDHELDRDVALATIKIEAGRYAIEHAAKRPGEAMTRLWRTLEAFDNVTEPIHLHFTDVSEPMPKTVWVESGYEATAKQWWADRERMATLDRPSHPGDATKLTGLLRDEAERFANWLAELRELPESADGIHFAAESLRHQFVADAGYPSATSRVNYIDRETRLYAILYRFHDIGLVWRINAALSDLREIFDGFDACERMWTDSASDAAALDAIATEHKAEAIAAAERVIVSLNRALEVHRETYGKADDVAAVPSASACEDELINATRGLRACWSDEYRYERMSYKNPAHWEKAYPAQIERFRQYSEYAIKACDGLLKLGPPEGIESLRALRDQLDDDPTVECGDLVDAALSEARGIAYAEAEASIEPASVATDADDAARERAGLVRSVLEHKQALRGLAGAVVEAESQAVQTTGDDEPPQNAGTVAERLERWRSAGEAYTTQRKMAKRLGCSTTAVGNALKTSDALKLWGRSNRRPPKRIDAVPLNGVVMDGLKAAADEPIDDYTDEQVEAALAYLLNHAKPAERADIHGRSVDEQRQLAVMHLLSQADHESSPLDAKGTPPKVYKRA